MRRPFMIVRSEYGALKPKLGIDKNLTRSGAEVLVELNLTRNRMKRSSVLVFGTSGLSIELMKNLVLAGVGHLIVVDKKIVQSGELGSNFYINSADQGKLV